jgi:uncharacterized protein (DUF342 family)
MSGEAKTGIHERIKVKVSNDSMSVSIVMHRPEKDQPEITKTEVLEALQSEGVVFGVDEAAIEDAIQNEVFVTPVRVAEGEKPEPGEPAGFEYHFQTDLHRRPTEGEDGRIDYRDISVIQNTHEGDLLVVKTPPTRGKSGKTVYGKEIAGPLGRDAIIKYGANTTLSEDGLELRAASNGTILHQRGKVSVNDVTTIPSDVDFSVGNIDCAGSVRIGGDIKAGFTVRVDGNLEVSGNVEDARVEVNGSILIKGGFYGDGKGHMQADNDITIKYAESQTLEAGGDIVVGGEIIQCRVTAGGSVTVLGGRGKIVGGYVHALKEIRAGIVGSDAGTKTVLRVGYEKDIYEQRRVIRKEIDRLNADQERVKQALVSLYRIQVDGKLPPDKLVTLAKLKKLQEEIPAGLEEMNQSVAELDEEIKLLEDARIVVDTRLHGGVKAYFGLTCHDVHQDHKRCNLQLRGGRVVVSVPSK